MKQTQIFYRPLLSRRPSSAVYRPEYRRLIAWEKLSNIDLKFALDLLELHGESEQVIKVIAEIKRRVEVGIWFNVENPPPPLHNVPGVFYFWPFSLLWRQRPKEE